MSLARALRVERGAVVSFVGGGGKTTSMFRLAAELSAAGLRVVTTTTTHISKEQVHLAPASIALDEMHLLDASLDRCGHCLLIGPPDGKGRVFGASSDLIDMLHARAGVDVVLVEADGSRSLPFKAPGHHEPVVPGATTILVPIAGMNALGQPLDEAHVHRSELVAALSQQPLGSPVTATTLARVLSHPEGGAKQCPNGAHLAPMLNRIDIETDAAAAREAAAMMLATGSVDTVLLGCVQHDPPVREAWAPTAGIVLAAGKTTCRGSVKQDLPWNGPIRVAHSVRTALDAGLNPVIVVLGYQAETIERSLAGFPVQPIFNPDFEAGQSTSFRKGLEALPPRTGAAVFLPAGQPRITVDILRSLVLEHRQSFAPACEPLSEERQDNPVLFDRVLFSELMELRGDTGGRELLETCGSAAVKVAAPHPVLLGIDADCDIKKTGE